MLRTLGSLAQNSAKAAASAAAAGLTNYITAGAIDGGTLVGALTGDTPDSRPQLASLRQGFQKLVEHYVEAMQNDDARVIVFVDDLDRIRPGRAVALLEVLKNFMEVPHCVFIIACDYDVVREGVRDRLGIEEQGKVDAFFDKLFQVPFQMPVNSYQVDRFVQSYAKSLLGSRLTGSWKNKKAEDLATAVTRRVAEAVTIAIGTNPRSVKRFFNVADLMLCVDQQRESQGNESSHKWDDEHYISTYLSVVAMHSRWPEVTAYVSALHSREEFIRALNTLTDAPDAEEAMDEELECLLQSCYGEGDDEGTWRD